MPTVAIYARQSLDKTKQAAAVERQEAECRDLCAERGWEVAAVYSDNSKSASTGKRRPEYERMLADLPSRSFDTIVAWDPDRLHRQPVELERFIKLVEEHGVAVVTKEAGHWDLSTPAGRAVARTLGAWARFEIEHKSERQKAGNRQRAVAGEPRSGQTPFGYRRVVERASNGKPVSSTFATVEVEAEAVARAYDRLLAGGSIRGIAASWTAAGLTTTAGSKWTAHAVRRRLQDPTYAGLVHYEGDQVATGNWPAIVDEQTWRAAVALLSDEGRRTATDYTRQYLLPGLALCGVEGCGHKVATGRSHRGVRTYVCAGPTRHLARKAEDIDNMVTSAVIARLSRDDAREQLLHDATPAAVSLTNEAQTLRARADDLALMFARGTMKRRPYELAAAEVDELLADIEAQLSRSDRAGVLRDVVTKDAAAVWETLDLDRRRRVIAELMTVTLDAPGRGKKKFEESSVRIVFR